MLLQVKVYGSSHGCNAKVEFQLRNCSKLLLLHWGGIYRGQTNWVLPTDRPVGTKTYKQSALQTPFMKSGDLFLITIELRDPKIHAIEFVLKYERHDKWLKLGQRNFRIEIPEAVKVDSNMYVPKDLVEHQAYSLWESMGRPRNTLQQQQENYEVALRALQSQLSKGVSLNELQTSFQSAGTKETAVFNEPSATSTSTSKSTYTDVSQWLHQRSDRQTEISNTLPSGTMNLVKKSIGKENMISQQSFHVDSHEIVAILRADYHILVAVNMKGATVLHWGLSKVSPGQWLVPPPEMLPKRSKLVDGACQTYFSDMIIGERSLQLVDIDLQQRDFVGIQFIIWSGGSWIKNNGSNFCFSLKEINPKWEQVEGVGKGIARWLLDEISQREKDAERSLMHRFNIAAELTELSKTEGELGLIAILVWLRFMACRQLTWNKNYNVKPREISAAQDKFTSLLQRIYYSQPNHREILRLIMATIGRGGQGELGQKIRDEILVLQRNNDCKGGMMEEWHQKLHNNSSPDDVIICQALLDYVRSDFKIDAYWRTLNAGGITKNILRSYDRPIVSEPHFRVAAKEGLLRDLTSYLKTLKAVHTGADLESAIETWLSYSSKDKSCLKEESLSFVKVHIEDKNIGPLMKKLLESRIELRPLLLTCHERLKDLIFLDLSLDSTVRTTMERGLKELSDTHIQGLLFFISVLLQNLCLSTVANEDLIYCTKDWSRVCDSYKPNDKQWALQAKAVIDRVRLALSDKSQYYQEKIQPSARYLGNLLRVEKWAVDIFTEELVRAGSSTTLSLLVNRLDPILRNIANLGCWQIISPVEVCGIVAAVNELSTVQTTVYKQPTIIIANKVSGEEEIPDGIVGVLTPDMPDVLSHVSVRARNCKVCFATCFDQSILKNLKLKEGRAISIQLKSTGLLISDISNSALSHGQFISSSVPRGTILMRKVFGGIYALAIQEFTNDMVGAKSRNIQYLRGRVPAWIKIPASVAIPFGVFETLIASDLNKDVSHKLSSFSRLVSSGDLSKLAAVQETILQMKAPPQLINELRSKMKISRIPWPGDEGDERWNQGWKAIKKVWASKWNQRAYISCRKAGLNHDHLCMSVLIQEVISADYAFVIHTRNPLSGNSSEIYAEIVRGLGETLVGAYAGRAMSFITNKSDLNSPIVLGYPSKQIGLYIKKSLIFRSDSNGEDLEGYAGAGLYDSVPMDKEQKIVLDYSSDRLIIDKAFQRSIFSKIAAAGKIIEDLYRSSQDIEGVVKDGEIYVVQTRPQV